MLDDDDGMSGAAPKRVGPPDVEPVVQGTLRFEVVHWGRERGLAQNGGYIAAFDAASDRELWTLKIYDVAYDPDLEEDVQDVFIDSMIARGSNALEIVDERGQRYLVDTAARKVRSA